MKKKYITCLVLALLLLASFSVIAAKPAESAVTGRTGTAAAAGTSADKEKVLAARFLNMLNHSYAYGEELSSVEALANCSAAALYSMCDSADDSYIAESYVRDYLYNMYGVEADNLSAVNAGYPHKDGYVYIIPRGYSVYRHTVDSVKLNEDGSYTVTTFVTMDSHDGTEEGRAVTLFVKNENSQFGFNIISSDIITDIADI